MNRVATAYFGTQFGVFAFCAWILHATTASLTRVYADLLGGKRLPPVTEWVVTYPWWPFCLLALSVIGLVLALLTSAKSQKLQHVAFAIQCFSTLCVLVAMLAYLVPFIPMISSLSA